MRRLQREKSCKQLLLLFDVLLVLQYLHLCENREKDLVTFLLKMLCLFPSWFFVPDITSPKTKRNKYLLYTSEEFTHFQIVQIIKGSEILL